MLALPSTLLSNAMKFARIHARSFGTVVLKVGGITQQTTINNLNVFKSFQLMLAQPSTLLPNAMKFARMHARSFGTVVLKVGGITHMWRRWAS